MPASVCPAATSRMVSLSRTEPAWNERLASRTFATSCCSVTPNSASFSGSGSTRICLRIAAGNVGQADIVGFHQFGAQLIGKLIEVLVGPARRRFRLGRQREHHDGDVVDAAADDQRFGNSDRDAVDVGANLLVHP